jgi:hypothetical protein
MHGRDQKCIQNFNNKKLRGKNLEILSKINFEYVKCEDVDCILFWNGNSEFSVVSFWFL